MFFPYPFPYMGEQQRGPSRRLERVMERMANEFLQAQKKKKEEKKDDKALSKSDWLIILYATAPLQSIVVFWLLTEVLARIVANAHLISMPN